MNIVSFFKKNKDKIFELLAYFFGILALLFLIISISVIFSDKDQKEKIYQIQIVKDNNPNRTASINFEDSVYQYIKKLGIKHPDVIFSQAKLESNNFQSDLFIKHNNMFGMKKAYNRPSTNISDDKNYAQYDNWQDSVLDYALFQASLKKKQFDSDEEYAKYISSFYAEDEQYYNKLLKFLN